MKHISGGESSYGKVWTLRRSFSRERERERDRLDLDTTNGIFFTESGEML